MKQSLPCGDRLADFASIAILATFVSFPVYALDKETIPSTRDDLTAKDLARVLKITQPVQDFGKAERFEKLSAGRASASAEPAQASYSHPNLPLSVEDRQTFQLGFSIFKKLWVSSPASTKASDGLGPLYNARSCLRCHPRNGRGHPPQAQELDSRTFLLRLSVPPKTEDEKALIASKQVNSLPDPVYGGQLQDRALPGLPAEAKIHASYEFSKVTLADGAEVDMRRPSFSLSDFGYGKPSDDMMMSPRIATAMIGLGLIDAIHPADIIVLADPEDEDGDGISGKVNWVPHTRSGGLKVGRFGWKATEPTVYQQSSHAAVGDIGLSVPVLPSHVGDCTAAQTPCKRFPHGGQANLGGLELPPEAMDLLYYYSANLAVPERRDQDDAEVLEGKKVFYEAGCIACHRPKYVTSRDADLEQHRFQLIWPYSDFLLHDMGPDLADDRPIGDASGSEWRTAPLWGIGMAQKVDPEARFLHDGRARTLLEAVLWHGGEAQAARDRVVELPTKQRKALLVFLRSL